MARPYVSQLESMRQRALSENKSPSQFWRKWNEFFTKSVESNHNKSADYQQYKAEREISKYFWGKEFFPGQHPESDYVAQLSYMQQKAVSHGISVDTFSEAWDLHSRGRHEDPQLSRDYKQYRAEKATWEHLWGATNEPFPGIDPRTRTQHHGVAPSPVLPTSSNIDTSAPNATVAHSSEIPTLTSTFTTDPASASSTFASSASSQTIVANPTPTPNVHPEPFSAGPTISHPPAPIPRTWYKPAGISAANDIQTFLNGEIARPPSSPRQQMALAHSLPQYNESASVGASMTSAPRQQPDHAGLTSSLIEVTTQTLAQRTRIDISALPRIKKTGLRHDRGRYTSLYHGYNPAPLGGRNMSTRAQSSQVVRDALSLLDTRLDQSATAVSTPSGVVVSQTGEEVMDCRGSGSAGSFGVSEALTGMVANEGRVSGAVGERKRGRGNDTDSESDVRREIRGKKRRM